MATLSYWHRLVLLGTLATILALNTGRGLVLASPPLQRLPTTDSYSFVEMGFTEQVLRGPYDTQSFPFSLPAHWQLREGAALHLEINTLVLEGGSEVNAAAGGSLSVRLNGQRLTTIPLRSGTIQDVVVPIDGDALLANEEGRYDLNLLLDSATTCTNDRKVEVTIRDSSNFTLPYTEVAPTIDLTTLPHPFYQRTFLPESALVVVPDMPTVDELQAALIVAAGFGRMTANRLPLLLRRVGDLSEKVDGDNNLILVGKPGSLPLLATMDLATALADTTFTGPGLQLDDGVVQLVPSPWNPGRVALVVSGNSDAAVVKASQAVAARQLLVNEQRNLAYITDVIAPEQFSDIGESRSLADLGYRARRADEVGATTFNYDFFLPEDQSLADKAYLDLVFAHSPLLDPNQSSLSVSLNGVDIGGVRLGDEANNQTTVRVNIPRSIGQAGRNQLGVRANLVPLTACIDRDTIDLWATVLPESMLQLPLSSTRAFTIHSLSLGVYPAPFTRSPTLGSMAVVLSANDPTGWETALTVMADLGNRVSGSVLTVAAAYSDNIPDTMRQERDLLVIGRPSALPIISELNADLPAPFDPNSDQAINRRTQALFRTGTAQEESYLELLSAPWNNQRVVLGILGTSEQGLGRAVQAMINPESRARLGGSFARVVDDQIFIGGTQPVIAQPAQPTAVEPSDSSDTAQEETTFPEASAPSGTTSLLVPLGISVVAMLLLVCGIVGASWLRRRKS